MIDAYCLHRSHAHHLAPIWRALPAEDRGSVYTELSANELAPYFQQLGLTPVVKGRPWYEPDVVLIAGGADLQAGAAQRPVVMIEHGAGQTYEGQDWNPCYSGGDGREAVSVFLCPNEWTAARNTARYPEARSVVIGAPTVPGPAREGDGTKVVAITFHWECPVAPEAGTGWHHWGAAAIDLAAAAHRRGYSVVGHHHPRWGNRLSEWWRRNGVEPVEDVAEVWRRADVLVADNTSLLWEWGRADRPVVVLDTPGWRWRHGPPRFGPHADVGVRTSETAELPYAVEAALADPPHVAAARRRLAAEVFPHVGDDATARAVEAIQLLRADVTG